jgi:hypothetical protein
VDFATNCGAEMSQVITHSKGNRGLLRVLQSIAANADPAFAPLEQWLRLRQMDPTELQAAVDQYLDQARQAALAKE